VIETSARLLRLLGLLQARRDWTGPELAHRLGVTSRTVRRDVERLRELGYPVEAQIGTLGGYRLGRGSTLPPLLLDDDECLSLVVALRAVALTGLGGVEEGALGVLAKLDPVLPNRLRRRARSLAEAVSTPTARGPQLDPEVLTTVAAAVRDTRELRADYLAYDGSTSRRRVEPHRIVHTGTRWYLLAFDLDRGDWRVFRLDRFSPRPPEGQAFSLRPLPAADPVAYVLSRVHTSPYRLTCRVTVDAPAAEVAGRLGIHAASVTFLSDQSCTVTAGTTEVKEMAIRLLALDADLQVHEPEELRVHLQAVGRRLRSV